MKKAPTTMEEKKMMVDEKENKERKKKKREEGKGGKKGRNFVRCKGNVSQWKGKQTHTSMFGLVWFNGLDSSRNDQNGLIHNWCIGGWWVTAALLLPP